MILLEQITKLKEQNAHSTDELLAVAGNIDSQIAAAADDLSVSGNDSDDEQDPKLDSEDSMGADGAGVDKLKRSREGDKTGGRSRSRKRLASKRTARRKATTKKQKSKKNKRQSRRKSRRSSSRRSRK
jgi:hypothetical protein